MAPRAGQTSVMELVENNLNLVPWTIIRMGLREYAEYDDLEQAGRLGLIRAAEGYDPNRGKFSTYAVNWIKAAVVRERQSLKSPRLPVNTQNKVRTKKLAEDFLTQRHGREATEEELIAEVGEQTVALDSPPSIQYFDAPGRFDNDWSGPWLETDEDGYATVEAQSLLDCLTDEERGIVAALALGYNYGEIAEAMGRPKIAVQRQVKKIRKKLRDGKTEEV